MNKKTPTILILAALFFVAGCGTTTPPSGSLEGNDHPGDISEERVTGNQKCDDYIEFLICSEKNNPELYKESSRKALSESLKNIPTTQLEEICTILIELDGSRVDNNNSCALEHLQEYNLSQ